MTGRPQRGQSPSRPASIAAASPERMTSPVYRTISRHEPARVEAAALDLAELRLPLARQLRALQAPVLDQGHEVAAQVRRGERLLLPRDVAPLQQGLDDRRPRRGRAQALLLERLLELLVVDQLAGRLHRPEQARLGVGLRRRRLAPPDGRLVRAALAGAELGQLLLVLASCRRPCGGTSAVQPGSSTRTPLARNGTPFDTPGDGRHLLDAGRVEGGDQAGDDGVVDLLRRRREGPRPLAGRDDRVVVAHLRVVDDPPGEGEGVEVQLADLGRLEGPELAQDARDLRPSCRRPGSASRSSGS